MVETDAETIARLQDRNSYHANEMVQRGGQLDYLHGALVRILGRLGEPRQNGMKDFKQLTDQELRDEIEDARRFFGADSWWEIEALTDYAISEKSHG